MQERLYPRVPTLAVDAAEGHFEAEEDGGFDFPGPLAAQLHSARHSGRQVWETSVERQERTHGEDLARRRDPAAAYDALERLTDVLGRAASAGSGREPLDPEEEEAALRVRLAELEAARGGTKPPRERKTPAAKSAPSE